MTIVNRSENVARLLAALLVYYGANVGTLYSVDNTEEQESR